MRFKRASLVLACAFVFGASLSSHAASNRMANRFGLHAGMIGDPFPTLVGANLDYNLFDFLRLTAGYGKIGVTSNSMDPNTLQMVSTEIAATTLGGGARFMVPNWSFSPIVGISYANVNVTVTGGTTTEKVGGFSDSGNHMYVTAGFDWQTAGGFNLGFGYNLSLKENVGGLPFVNIGMYF